MFKETVIALVLVALVAESTCEFKIIQPTYRTPIAKRPPVIRHVRDVEFSDLASGLEDYQAMNEEEHESRITRSVHREPLWLNKGDVIKAPATDDHPKLPTYIDDIRLDSNTRYARDIRPGNRNPIWRPQPPKPDFPQTGRVHLGRVARGLNVPGMKRPTQRDIVIPNWNPHLKSSLPKFG